MHADLLETDEVRLVIEAHEDTVRVEVEQPTAAIGVAPVEPRLDDPDRVSGFGLRMVQELTDDWGVVPGPPGSAWFEIRR